MKLTNACCSIIFVGLLSAHLVAQETTKSRTVETRTIQSSSTDNVASFLAAEFILCNQNEVAVAEMAASKASNEEVKAFAQMLAKDHSAMIEKLTPFAKNFAAQIGETRRPVGNVSPTDGEPKRDEQAREKPSDPPRAKTDQSEVRTQAASGSSDLSALFNVCREAKQNVLNSTQEELSSKQGADFDKCFVGMQLMGHAQMIAHLKAASDVGSADFQNVIKGAISSAENHLKKAKELEQKIMTTSAPKTGESPSKPK